jgi:hypothetical protein
MNPKALHRNFKKFKKRENNPFVVVDPLSSSTTLKTLIYITNQTDIQNQLATFKQGKLDKTLMLNHKK